MSPRLIALLTLPVWLGCYEIPSQDNQPTTTDPECQLQTEGERNPGYPYDLTLYADEILPLVTASCSAAGCHGAPQGAGDFTLWADAAPGNCDYAKTFNSIARAIDLANPTNSAIYTAINGASATHPIKYPEGDPVLATLLGYINDASARYLADGGSGDPAPPGASPFDYGVFQSTIQPILDTAGGSGCSTAGCHGTGAGTLTLVSQPAADSPDMEANFLAVTRRTNLDNPAISLFYRMATTAHSGGVTPVVNGQQGAAILAWIEDAKNNAGDDVDGNCAPIDRFNVGVFRDEIMPILEGKLNLNAPGNVGGIGCTVGPCHGTDRGPGSLTLRTDASATDNLRNFACFVNLQSPASSEVLACPLNDPRCRRYPHPGQNVFTGAQDLNYQRVLAFLYGSRLDATPLDFAFFVRRINPIFNDLELDASALGRSCADTGACHGINIVGQQAANGSNFPILPNASDSARLTFNYVSSAGFINFLQPEESSLFLYPTNEIANVADHPLATGLPHPGGQNFAVDSEEARALLTWARGLRPDGQGFQRNWLVAGDYPASQLTDQTAINEGVIVPRIFDPSGAQLGGGQWDGLFAADRDVDLAAAFPRGQGIGRVVYAVAYLVNTTPLPLRTQIAVSTPNAVRVYVDGALVAQDEVAGGVTAITSVPAFFQERKVTRVMLKIFQRPNDPDFRFTVQLRDELGNLLTDSTGELIITLGPDGGI